MRIHVITSVLALALSACSGAYPEVSTTLNPSSGALAVSRTADLPEKNILPFSDDLHDFTKWNNMLARMERSMPVTEALNAGEGVSGFLETLRMLPLEERIKKVNEIVNTAPYIPDEVLWHQRDHWATPMELVRYGGDCEDFAIAKYFALARAGVPEKDMRVAIVYDLLQNSPHAVLIVETESGRLVLDNQYSDVRMAGQVREYYRFIYSINRAGWWRHRA